MKKLLAILLVLVSFVSYSQVVEKQTTYVIKMNEQEYNEYVNGKPNNIVTQKKRHYGNKHNDKSFGAVAGYSSSFIGTSAGNVSWGAYIDLGKIGIEYNASAGLNANIGASEDYILGKTNEYISGIFSRNIGVFIKSRRTSLYYGGGIQLSEEMGCRNIIKTTSGVVINGIKYPTASTSIPTTFDENKIYPYATIGYIQKLNDIFTFKGGLILSKTSMINVGVGYNF